MCEPLDLRGRSIFIAFMELGIVVDLRIRQHILDRVVRFSFRPMDVSWLSLKGNSLERAFSMRIVTF